MRKRINNIRSFFKKNKMAAYALVTIVILIVALIAELLISNIDTLFLDKDEYVLDVELLDNLLRELCV